MIENGAEVTKEPEIKKELVKPEIDEDREKEPEVSVQNFIIMMFLIFAVHFKMTFIEKK